MLLFYLFEKAVVGLFGGAYFYRFHHFAGGDDDAADEFGWAGHGVLWFFLGDLEGGIVWKGDLASGPGTREEIGLDV